MTKKKSLVFWIISVVFMLIIVVFQKMTGPTYPHNGSKVIGNTEINFHLPRSSDGDYTKKIEIKVKDKNINGKIKYKRFKSYDEWTTNELKRKDDKLFFNVPHQPAAGKVIYQIFLRQNSGEYIALTDKPVIMRYRDPVPAIVIIFHLFFIFLTITMAIRTGLEAIYKGDKVWQYSIITVIAFVCGGFIFGPLMQKFAFGAYWTGWPFGHDLTDNKVLVALIVWIIALWKLKKNRQSYGWATAASIVLLLVYLIPHSLLGSEIDYTKIEKPKTEKVNVIRDSSLLKENK